MILRALLYEICNMNDDETATTFNVNNPTTASDELPNPKIYNDWMLNEIPERVYIIWYEWDLAIS